MKKYLLLLLTLSFITQAQMTDEIKAIQSRWAQINYNITKDKKEEAFEKLAKVATQFVVNNPSNSYAHVWEGIVYSTYAGVAGTFSAGKLAKHAKKSFELAIKLDGSILNGSAYTSLGVLYYKVPGWPLSFGNDKKAVKNLKKGLELNPDGIDSNYFYAEYLFDEEDAYQQAQNHLLKAQNAVPRPTRPLADEGRHKELTQLLKKVNEELAD
jgi:tetratricopeptide (TPR) repeat protein